MKTNIILVIILGFSNFVIGQISISKPSKCKNCESEIKSIFFQKYYSNLKIICKNNKEYFGKNLDNYLKPTNSQAHIFNLKFDALGAVYPATKPDKEFRKYFERRKGIKSIKTNRYLYRNTFYKMPESERNRYFDILDPSKGFLKTQRTSSKYITPPKGSVPNSNQLEFTKNWNDVFLKNQIENLNKKIEETKVENLFFIIHGYNVPYSLAQIQANAIIDQTFELDSIKAKNTLFVKVFWPSTSRKKLVVENNSFIVKNKINLYSISAFRSIATRTYLVGHSLRQILNDINNIKGNVYFFSHSLGAQVATSTFILPQLEVIKDTVFFKYFESDTIKNNNFNSVKLFLNAPAMPGKPSFPDSTLKKLPKTKWTVGYNPTDKVLRKTVGFIRFGDQNGNTRLGGNWENETWEFQDYLSKIVLKEQFKIVQTGSQYDLFGHDFFCYLIQSKFQGHFKIFYLGE